MSSAYHAGAAKFSQEWHKTSQAIRRSPLANRRKYSLLTKIKNHVKYI